MNLPIQWGMRVEILQPTERLIHMKKRGADQGAVGCCSNCVKKCKGPKIKTPGISQEKAPDCAEQSQQIGLHAYANHSAPPLWTHEAAPPKAWLADRAPQ